MHRTITEPGHATNLTGVKPALADGTVEARCHDAVRLDALLDAACVAGTQPSAQFSAHEHQLFVEVDPALHTRGIGTEYVSPRSSTGAFAALNLALPWHADVPCGRKVAA